jgi:hypothetical protein
MATDKSAQMKDTLKPRKAELCVKDPRRCIPCRSEPRRLQPLINDTARYV